MACCLVLYGAEAGVSVTIRELRTCRQGYMGCAVPTSDLLDSMPLPCRHEHLLHHTQQVKRQGGLM